MSLDGVEKGRREYENCEQCWDLYILTRMTGSFQLFFSFRHRVSHDHTSIIEQAYYHNDVFLLNIFNCIYSLPMQRKMAYNTEPSQ